MPSPLAHIAAGYGLSLLYRKSVGGAPTHRVGLQGAVADGACCRPGLPCRGEASSEAWRPGVGASDVQDAGGRLFDRSTAAMLVLSLLPDMDAVPGVLLHNMGKFHNNFTHSIAAAILFAAVAGIVARILGKGGLRWFMIALSCVGLHLLMDLFTWGRGVMLFWPLSSLRILPPVKLFYGLHWSEGVFSTRHLWTLLTEGALILAVVALRLSLVAYSRRKKGETT